MQVEPQGNPAPQAGQGNSAPEAGQGEGDSPKFVTVEDLNRAITARQKALESKLDGKFGEFKTSFETFQASIAEALKPKQEPAKETPGKDKGAPPPVTEAPEFQDLQKQLKALQLKNDAAEKKAAEAETKRRDAHLRQQVDEALARAGADATRIKHARGLLVDAFKQIRFSEDGDSVVMLDSEGNESDLHAGIKTWLKSDDGKIYLPPRGTTGSGDRGGGSAPRTDPNAVTKESIGADLVRLL